MCVDGETLKLLAEITRPSFIVSTQNMFPKRSAIAGRAMKALFWTACFAPEITVQARVSEFDFYQTFEGKGPDGNLVRKKTDPK